MIDYTLYNDQELGNLLKLDDQAVFKFFYDRYWEKLYFVASKKLNNPAEAEEIVQDIILKLWENRKEFQLKEGLDNYLAVSVKFQVIKRRAKRIRRSNIIEGMGLEAEPVTGSFNNWSQYDLEQLQLRLNSTIDALPAKCKLVFTMSRNKGYTNKKKSSKLGISEKQLKSTSPAP